MFELPSASASPWRLGSVLLPREGIFWLLAAGVMFVTGLFKGINLLILLAYLLIGLWVANLWMVERDLRKVRGKRRTPAAVFAGRNALFEVVAAARGTRPVRGITFSERLGSETRRWLALRLESERPVRLAFAFAPPRRGRQAIGPLVAQSLFPFGLVGRSVELAPVEEGIVLPRLGRVNLEAMRRWLAKATRGDGRSRRRHSMETFMEADVHGLREFRPGDSPRWIHWRSTARRNQVLVREFDQNIPPTLSLIVEPFLPDDPTDDDRLRLEKLISLAASICDAWRGDPQSLLSVVVLGETIRAHGPGNGWDFARTTLEWLAIEEGNAEAGDGREALRRLRGDAPLLALTSRSDSTLGERIAEAAGRLPAVLSVDQPIDWHECPFSRE